MKNKPVLKLKKKIAILTVHDIIIYTYKLRQFANNLNVYETPAPR